MVEHRTGIVVGIWILISPWLLGFSEVALMRWSNVACGLILILINAKFLFVRSIPIGEVASGKVAEKK